MIEVIKSQNGSVILSNSVGSMLVVPAADLPRIVAQLSEMASLATAASFDLFGNECRVDLTEAHDRRVKAAFNDWWRIYPCKKGKIKAEKKFFSVIERGLATIDELLAGASRYAQSRVGEDAGFTMHPTTWLNGGHWGDEIAVSTRSRRLSKAESAAAGIDAYFNAYMGAQNEQSRGNPALTFDDAEEHKIGGG